MKLEGYYSICKALASLSRRSIEAKTGRHGPPGQDWDRQVSFESGYKGRELSDES